MNLHLHNKVCIVSGGSEGIGEAVSRALVAEGAVPVIATRTAAPTAALLAEFEAAGHSAAAVIGDLGSPAACERVVAEAVARFGRIDGVVNNAGVNDGVGLTGDPGAFRASLLSNLGHYFDLVHYALPHLKASRGAIVNIASKVALTGQGGTSGYAAAKGAQLALTREWAAELLPFGIRVNAVLPAEVMTPLYRRWLDSSFADPAAQEAVITARIPLGRRMTTPAEIAATVVFLLSEQSAHTTGQWLSVDGGYAHLDRAL
ncbi:MAG: SDR family oxidoreductase [Bacteroidia bacterium]